MSTTAMYLRLSSEDTDLKYSDKEESNSITNQRSLLDSFIRHTPELAETNVVEFCDDGWSGKNFERPAFQDMIEQVKKGKIQCIVVKDSCVIIDLNQKDPKMFGLSGLVSSFLTEKGTIKKLLRSYIWGNNQCMAVEGVEIAP